MFSSVDEGEYEGFKIFPESKKCMCIEPDFGVHWSQSIINQYFPR